MSYVMVLAWTLRRRDSAVEQHRAVYGLRAEHHVTCGRFINYSIAPASSEDGLECICVLRIDRGDSMLQNTHSTAHT
ncbi:hypothetical protein A0H81_11107 [Grifola frondosa]|uniref:Uncharacterized protein n=1 Tax=Grifola frondosa TaxID=5627 RepID=A0A1C7LXH9_GRIFR|nr:hypothetical protein A0H81_11107 [Grifola frondosa]